MKPRDSLGVGVRIVGLILTLIGAFFLLWAIGIVINLPNGVDPPPEAGRYATFGMAGLVPGLFLFLRPSYVVGLAYLFENDSESDTKSGVKPDPDSGTG